MAEASESETSATETRAADQTPQDQSPAGATRPDSIPETLWDAEKGGPKLPELAARFNELSQIEAAQAERAKDIPAEGKYELRLPADLKLPGGLDFKPDPELPLAKELLGYAQAQKLTQGEVDTLVGLYAKALVADHEAAAREYINEKQALGANAEDRISAAETWLGGMLTPAEFEVVRPVLTTAAGVAAMEKLKARMGAAQTAPNGAGSRAGETPDFSKMSPSQKIDWANRQSAMRG